MGLPRCTHVASLLTVYGVWLYAEVQACLRDSCFGGLCTQQICVLGIQSSKKQNKSLPVSAQAAIGMQTFARRLQAIWELHRLTNTGGTEW